MANAEAPASMHTEGVVKDFYGKRLNTKEDLKTSACTTQNAVGKYTQAVRDAMKGVHEEVASKYYGCGLVFPPAIDGVSVLDLGSGSGHDCFILSRLVGEKGTVTGLDMTDEQLAVSNKYIDYHTQLYKYEKPNVNFIKGNMEKMEEAGVPSNTYDLIVSNCVINLAKNKFAVLKEAHRVLKNGGQLYFSDVYADRDLPPNLREHEELWCECVAGALWWKDLYKLAKEIGFTPPRLVSAGLISVEDKDYKKFLGDAKFVSVTYSLFKLPEGPESDKLTVQYNGGIDDHEEELSIDYAITFKKGEEAHVKPGLANILQNSRYSNYFTFSSGEKGPCKCAKLEKDPFEYCAERGNAKSCC